MLDRANGVLREESRCSWGDAVGDVAAVVVVVVVVVVVAAAAVAVVSVCVVAHVVACMLLLTLPLILSPRLQRFRVQGLGFWVWGC